MKRTGREISKKFPCHQPKEVATSVIPTTSRAVAVAAANALYDQSALVAAPIEAGRQRPSAPLQQPSTRRSNFVETGFLVDSFLIMIRK